MELTGLAMQYGINVQHVAAGHVSGLYSPFHPTTRKMQNTMSDSIDRYYDQFKGKLWSLEHVWATEALSGYNPTSHVNSNANADSLAGGLLD
jgi:ClpP class serine protease